jgi:hypothetical protein
MTRPLITVSKLLAQVRETGGVQVPEDALITPAAQDWLMSARVDVKRTGPAVTQPNGGFATLYIVGDAKQPVVQTILPGLERKYPKVSFLPCNGHMGGLLAAVRQMCTGLSECDKRKGVVLVRDGAPVCCLANRFEKVRAAILPKPSALYSLQRELGVNCLIIERERISLSQTQATIDAFMTGQTAVDPVIAAALGGHDAGPASNLPSGTC